MRWATGTWRRCGKIKNRLDDEMYLAYKTKIGTRVSFLRGSVHRSLESAFHFVMGVAAKFSRPKGKDEDGKSPRRQSTNRDAAQE